MSSFEQYISLLRGFQYFCVVVETLLVHDYFLTIPLEVDYIWPSRWSVVKVIFLLSRYGTLAGQSFYTLQMLGVLSHGSKKFCLHFEKFVVFYGLFQTETIRILVLVRAWAIWGCKRYVAIIMIFAYTAYASVVCAMLIYLVVLRRGGGVYPFIHLAETGVCVLKTFSNRKHDHSWVLPFTTLFLDFTVSFLVTVSLAKLFKETQYLRQPRSLLRALAMDAALYLCASTIASVISILSLTIYTNSLVTNISLISNPIVTITGQRVVLNLRSMRSLPYSQQIANLNLVPESSLLSGSVEDFRRVLDGDPLPQEDSDRRNHESASGVEMLDVPVNRV